MPSSRIVSPGILVRLFRCIFNLCSNSQAEPIDTAFKADLVVLNTAIADEWLDTVLKETSHDVPPNTLSESCMEMRGYLFGAEYFQHLLIAVSTIDAAMIKKKERPLFV